MAAGRLGRDEFFSSMSGLDEDGLRKALWTLYWRGPATQRERIEALIDPQSSAAQARSATPLPPDARAVLAEVREFAALARAGAYLAGDRRVSPRERTRWRLTFRHLAQQAEQSLRGEDVDPAARAVGTLVDLACETTECDYFRSEDPMEAARFVVSDAVGLLWARMRDIHGPSTLTATATVQLLRWESNSGWTRMGFGSVAGRETSLATVLAGLLTTPDLWAQAARDYLTALDGGGGAGGGEGTRHPRGRGRSRQQRALDLCAWHLMLVERLVGSEHEVLLDQLVAHPSLGGPGLAMVKARYPRG